MLADRFLYPMIAAWLIEIFGMICLLIVIPTFLISKTLRSHPGSIILSCCIIEFIYYYGGFICLTYGMYEIDYISFNIYDCFIPAIHYCTFGIISPTINSISNYVQMVCGIMIIWLEIYYICLSLDIILIIRNPLYSPIKRVKLYHITSISFTLLIIFPLELVTFLNPITEKEILSDTERLFVASILLTIALITTTILFVTSTGSLIFSYLKIKKLILNFKQKRNLLRKIMIYQIFAIIFSLCLLFCNVATLILMVNYKVVLKYMSFTAYLNLYSTISLSISCIGVLPARMCEPGIAKYFSLRTKHICRMRTRRETRMVNKLEYQLENSQTYYAFMYSTLNGQLVESILCGITSIILSKLKMENIGNRVPQKQARYTFHLRRTVNDLLNARNPSEDFEHQSSLNTSFIIDPQLKQKHQFTNNKELIDIIEYSPKSFSIIQKHFGIKNELILNSINLEENRSNLFNIGESDGGKSGSFFFFTHDKKYLIKTISPEELQIFLKFLRAYTRHLTNEIQSILTIILGIYTLRITGLVPIHMILMVNSLPEISSYNIKYVFDLKGSLLNRYIKPPNKGRTLKDLNYLQINKKFNIINIPINQRNKLKKIVSRDVRFFEKIKIMDYSLLLGIAERIPGEPIDQEKSRENAYRIIYSDCGNYVYFLSIIDIFQKYNFQKKIEHSLKALKTKSNEISSIAPKPYADRFYYFVLTHILNIKTNQLNKYSM